MKKYIAFVLLIFLSCASRANTCPADKPVLWLDGVCITCVEAVKKFVEMDNIHLDEMGRLHFNLQDIDLIEKFGDLLENIEASCGATMSEPKE